MIEAPIEIIEIEPESYHILIHAIYNGIKVNLLLDTGASKSVFDKDSPLCKGLAVIEKSEIHSYSINQTIAEYGQVCFPLLIMGGKTLTNIDFTLIDFSFIHQIYYENVGMQIEGILGGDFFLRYKAIIDFSQMMLKLSI